VMVVHASDGGRLQGQVERWKTEEILIDYLNKI
jgi:hypothetical protein